MTFTQGTVNHPDFGMQELNYSVQELPFSGDGQVAATIQRMGQYVVEDCNSPEVMADAADAVREGQGDPLLGAFRLANKRIRFQVDSVTGGWGGKDVVEVLIRPRDVIALSQQGQMVPGDCDDFSMYVACVLMACGVPCKFVTVAADERDPSLYSHVYVAAYPDGRRKAVDASHGKFCGWEVANKFGKCREWDVVSSSSLASGIGGVDWSTLLLVAGVGAAAWWYFSGRHKYSIGSIIQDMWEDR